MHNNTQEIHNAFLHAICLEKAAPLVNRKDGNEEIEIVNNFNYLGVVLSSGGSFIKATSTLSGKALKAAN